MAANTTAFSVMPFRNARSVLAIGFDVGRKGWEKYDDNRTVVLDNVMLFPLPAQPHTRQCQCANRQQGDGTRLLQPAQKGLSQCLALLFDNSD
jgi:hypothetical protein